MGLEAKCWAHYGKQSGEGHAMWETDYLLFRGPFRVKIPRAEIRNVKAARGALTIEFGKDSLVLALGDASTKWADKILNPPSRLDKLGVKPGMRISVLSVADDQFVAEIEERGADVSTRRRKDSDIVFAGAEVAADLKFGEWRDTIQPSGAVWIVYPKGGKTIRESEVRAALLAAGLVDTKVAAFSPVLTAVKCVIPVAERAARTQTAK
jgi:hypothetical protein